jgi:hypothetical protein
MRKSMGHMLNRELSRGWTAWQEMLAERARLRKSMSHMLNRELSRGWSRWRETLAEAAAKLAGMRKSMGHMLNRELSRGWVGWQQMLEERKAALAAMRRGVMFMVNRKLAMAFGAFRPVAQRTADPMARALGYFMNRELSRGWAGWHQAWEAAYMTNRKLSAAFVALRPRRPWQPKLDEPRLAAARNVFHRSALRFAFRAMRSLRDEKPMTLKSELVLRALDFHSSGQSKRVLHAMQAWRARQKEMANAFAGAAASLPILSLGSPKSASASPGLPTGFSPAMLSPTMFSSPTKPRRTPPRPRMVFH